MNVPIQSLHPHLQYIVTLAPMLKKLFPSDITLSISDTEQIVFELLAKEFEQEVPNSAGRKLAPTDPITQVIKQNRENIFEVSKEQFGSDLRMAIIPIHDESKQMIGAMAVSSSIRDRLALIDIATKFTKSSEIISLSTEELQSSANNLTTYMDTIITAQQNLAMQVNDSAKILEMINTVAKSTRILGFNAGIEAARSGEHGLGFGVVAKEITKLADQSASSVNEINKLLAEMKQRVDEVSAIVKKTNALSDTQAAAIIDISESIQHLTSVAEAVDTLARKI